MKKWILLAIILVAALGLAYNYGFFQRQTSFVCFREGCINASLATTPYEKSRGLMQVSSLGHDSGMLFMFDRDGVYQFWMKDTLIPLDIIWIDSNYSVVFIKSNARPCSDVCEIINPGTKSRYVLEANSGTADRLDIVLGEKAEIA